MTPCAKGRAAAYAGIRVRSVLVAVEVAASVALLVWAGLLLRALDRIDGTDPGFRPESVLTARTALPRPKYTLAARRQALLHAGARAGARACPASATPASSRSCR